MHSTFVYLDYNSTTPTDERVLEAMLPFFTADFANPSGSHLFSLSIQDVVEQYTEQLAIALGAKAQHIIYTSGATEAINMAVKGLRASPRRHIVVVATEHRAVLETCQAMAFDGYKVTVLPVDHEGHIDLLQLAETVSENTLLVCTMLANNETGLIHPIRQISEIVHQKGALLLSDATQGVGKVKVDVRELGVDLLVFSGHKFYGPKGVGGLCCDGSANKLLSPLIHGGGQQQGYRSGTLNVPGIVGMSKALSLALESQEQDRLHIGTLRDILETGLLNIPGTFSNATASNRLFNTTNICFQGIQAEELLRALGNIAASSGSACTAVTHRPSHVLKAMGLSDQDGLSSLRFSLGRYNTISEIEEAIERIGRCVAKLRA